jgi:hypothetical protein
MTNQISHIPKNIMGVEPMTLEYSRGKITTVLEMRVFIYGIFWVHIVPQLLPFSYFHHHFHTHSITCSKELITLSMLLPVVTNYRQITLMDI